MHVAHRMPWLVRQPAAVPDVEAAGEADRSVDHHDLPMVAEVGVGEVDRHAGGQKPLHPHPLRRQHAHDRGHGVTRPDAVDQHPHLHAPSGHRGQGIGELPPGGIVVEDVGREADAAAGGMDGLQHDRVGLVAAGERFDQVAIEERSIGGPAHERRQRPQGRPIGPDRLGEQVWSGDGRPGLKGGAGHAGPEVGGAGADPVDAQQEVGDRSEHRRKPDQAHPADRRAGVPFDENRVGGRQNGEADHPPRQDVWPEEQPPLPRRSDRILHGQRLAEAPPQRRPESPSEEVVQIAPGRPGGGANRPTPEPGRRRDSPHRRRPVAGGRAASGCRSRLPAGAYGDRPIVFGRFLAGGAPLACQERSEEPAMVPAGVAFGGVLCGRTLKRRRAKVDSDVGAEESRG